MKSKLTLLLGILASALCPQALAQGTAFTYQGRLTDNDTPYTGSAEFQATLWDAANGGTALATNSPATVVVGVTNGLFMLPVDFRDNFPGADRWLQLEVRATIGAFTILSPRQKLTAAPYAITASQLTRPLPAAQLSGAIPSASLSGTYSGAVTFNNAANTFSGSGAGLSNVNATALDGLSSSAFWRTEGNAGTTPGTHFVGTTNNQALEFKVGGRRVFRIEDNGDGSDAGTTPDGAPNLIGGSPWNFVGAGVVGATIAGGGATNYAGTARTNLVLADYGAVGGGVGNQVLAGALGATVTEGELNTVASGSEHGVIGGGRNNGVIGRGGTIAGGLGNTTWGAAATIGGGQGNGALANGTTVGGGTANFAYGTNSTINGGYNNAIAAGSDYATISGGRNNTILANSLYATVVGGRSNTASGNYPTAMSVTTRASGSYSTAMGYNTTASGDSSTAMGTGTTASGPSSTALGGGTTASGALSSAMGFLARANHQGSFVWADYQGSPFSSVAENEFAIRASGGVRLSPDTPHLSFGSSTRQMLNLYGNTYGIGVQDSTLYQRSNSRFSWFQGSTHSDPQNIPGSGGSVLMTLTSSGLTVNGAFVHASDRDAKEDFAPVDGAAVLEKVAALPLHQWRYKADAEGSRHLGPMAQDFHAAFGLGADDKHIATVDADGVALAAIQGLNQKVVDRGQRSEVRIRILEERLEQKETETAELKQTVNELKEFVQMMSRRFTEQHP